MKVTTDACLFGAWAAEEMKNEKFKIKNALDIGAGTGLLSLMLAQSNTSIAIDTIEIDHEAYDQAKENVSSSPFADRVSVIHADVKKFPFVRKYDVVISNPPFYENEIASVDIKRSVAQHQSGLTLNELVPIIKASLSQAGNFFLLLPFKRNEEIKKIFLKQNLGISKIVFVRQSTRHAYFRMMLAGTLDKSADETSIEEISIWDDHQQYTDRFKELLESYYLYL